MNSDGLTHIRRTNDDRAAPPPSAGLVAAVAGGAFALLAGVALWASEGPGLFVQAAFASMAACL